MSENIYGGAFPWANLFGVSGLGGGMSDEDLAWQAYLEYSGLPQAGVSGDDYLGSFLPEIDTSALSAEMEGNDVDLGGLPSLAELIAGGTLTADASGVTGSQTIDDSLEDDLPEGGSDDDEQSSILDLLGWPWFDGDDDVDPSDPSDTVDDEEDDDYFIPPEDQPKGKKPGDVIDDTPYDEDDLIDDEVGGDGIRDMLPEALKGMYDKLGIGGILSILGILGLGGSKGSSASQGGIGSFASSQFDPSGLVATADYANMPGGGVGQPTWLPNTNAPIYYPFASEVTKQYNAQQGGPFSFTAGPPPEAMIQNLPPQRIPGVTYVADGAFVRRNGLTEGPGTETSDDIPAMLSDGEFVTNAEANRGIGAMALLNQGMPQEVAMDPEQQRLAGARQMYLQQAMGQQLAKQMRNR